MALSLPALWGGPECTVNRLGDVFIDQFERSAHLDRLEDIDLFSGLGISAIRYPISWERIAPERSDRSDWRWVDPRLHRLRDLGVEVIAGLVHHGGGPHYTGLLDDAGFAVGLADHARRAAERYPWIERWTPVNEPVTTARFAALYGHWYPHARDERAFWRALLNQIDAVRLSMAAIRTVNADAKLIQTDDLGHTYSTHKLRAQAAFDNLRRWAGWDLLCGRVTRHHPLRERLVAFGFGERLDAIAAEPCPPDVIGVNHYLTSDRFLDHRLELYPAHTHGGNGRDAYADVAAIRALDPPPPGLGGALKETWERYRIPVALTEIHNGCTREEQLRWIAESWDTGLRLIGEDVDLRAITIWSLLGSHDWNTLLTEPGVYEPGAFDVSSGRPRETAIAKLMRGLPSGAPRHPVVIGAGWWRCPERLFDHTARAAPGAEGRTAQPLLILGATGTLGQAFARACTHRNIAHRITTRGDLDLLDGEGVRPFLNQLQPWAVVNAAGWVRVDEAESNDAACYAVNATGAIQLASAASQLGIQTLNFSSDLVFDGSASTTYIEGDAPSPLNAYGRSKAAMEAGLTALPGRHLIVRTAAFFSPFDSYNFAHAAASALGRGEAFRAASDQVVSPTYVPHLVDAALDLLIDGETGIWHLTSGTALSWAAFAQRVATRLALPVKLIETVSSIDMLAPARRPRFAAMSSSRCGGLPSLETALDQLRRSFHYGLRCYLIQRGTMPIFRI